VTVGALYVNYTIRTADQKSVARALANRRAFVSPQQNGAVVAFDQESDKQDFEVITSLSAQIATQLRRPVFAVLLHDSDIFPVPVVPSRKLVSVGAASQVKRRIQLNAQLNLPDFAIGYGFESIFQGDLPKGLSAKNLIAV
jgi:hypothetical protein